MKNNQDKLILSISFCYHDSSITFANDEKVILCLEAERYFRKKHKKFDNLEEVDELVKYGLDLINKNINDVDELIVSQWENLYDGGEATILGKKFNYEISNHHNNHIGVTFPSNYNRCVIYVSDGGSENGTTKVYYKDGNDIWLAEDLDDFEFTGMFYGTIAQALIEPDFDKAHTSAVGKLMGLSSLGTYNKNIEKIIYENINELNTLHLESIDSVLDIFGLSNDYDKVWKNNYKLDIANTAHNLWVKENEKILKKHRKFSKNICLSGGCALNISLNSKLLEDKVFENVYVSPISTDAGQSLGAILFKYPTIKVDYPFLGYGEELQKDVDYDSIIKDLLEHKIISWYQGKSEIGARALGHRSFIGLPDSEDMRIKISEKIKKREPYRPVSVMIPLEYVSEYFEQSYESPYMTFCSKAKNITKKQAKAVVHYDGTTRVQTLKYEDNPIIYNLLIKLYELGIPPLLMNTSFNIMGEPIVNTIDDAIHTHKLSGADVLYINGKKHNFEEV